MYERRNNLAVVRVVPLHEIRASVCVAWATFSRRPAYDTSATEAVGSVKGGMPQTQERHQLLLRFSEGTTALNRQSAGWRELGSCHFAGGPTEIRTRVSAVRGQRPWPLDDGALPLQKFRGRDSNPDSTVQSRMSCLLDDPGDTPILQLRIFSQGS